MSKPSLIFIGALLLFSANLSAQISTDGSLGPRSNLTPEYNANLDSQDYQIGDNLGQQRGANLFHSFQEFNLNSNESATFSGPSTIQNVISRVTGGNRSEIYGLIRSTIPGADFYFLNPYGIIFGETATLDVQGSFHASTAHYLRLGENEHFYSDLGNQSILSVASPAAFGFLDYDPGRITVQGSFIEVSEKQDISIIGGDISIIEGGYLSAPSGRINLAAAASKGEVILTTDNLFMDSFETQGNIELFPWIVDGELWGQSGLDVSGNGGQIFIRAGQLLLDNAGIWAATDGEQSGLIDILVKGDIELKDSFLYAPGGQINLVAVGSSVNPRGKITLSQSVSFDDEEPVTNDEELATDYTDYNEELTTDYDEEFVTNEGSENEGPEANIDVSGEGGGRVVIRAGQFFLDGGTIYADNESGSIPDGGINIEVQGNMRLTNSARITAEAKEEVEENDRSGNIFIQAGKLEMNGLTNEQWILGIDQIMANFQPQFDGMNEAEATEFLTKLQAVVYELYEQDADISLDLILSEMGEEDPTFISQLFHPIFNTIETTSFGMGNGGNIKINTPILSIAAHSSIETATFTQGESSGNAGNIEINAQEISLQNYGFIFASTANFGRAGDITIRGLNQQEAVERLYVTNMSSITASSQFYTGDAGNININAHQLILDNGGFINGFSYDGTGKAGTIKIETDTAFLRGEESGIYTESDTGGGDIFLTVHNRLELFDNSRLTAEAFGDEPQDKGGNITIHNQQLDPDGNITIHNLQLVSLDQNSQLLTRGFVGDGGNINIFTNNLRVSNDSWIDSSSKFGLNGEVRINSLELNENFMAKPLNFLDASSLLNNRCAGLTIDTISRFIINIRDVLPPGPGDLMTHHLFEE
ncbi:Large exoprotein containing haemagglutination activity domain [Beggiatoa sp. PS]|nr:Large exoprotein containing haemagglutination activity domain [Beggiatoa sp. PS]